MKRATRASVGTHRSNVGIDLEGIAQRIIAVPALAQRNYSQLESGPADPDGGAQTACSVEIRIDDVAFVTQ